MVFDLFFDMGLPKKVESLWLKIMSVWANVELLKGKTNPLTKDIGQRKYCCWSISRVKKWCGRGIVVGNRTCTCFT